MSFTKSEIARIAQLARLATSENVLEHSNQSGNKQETAFLNSIADDLSNILNLIKKIEEVDTKDVEPMSHPYPMLQRLRTDVVTEPNVVTEMQAIAPADSAKDNLYIVPPVIE